MNEVNLMNEMGKVPIVPNVNTQKHLWNPFYYSVPNFITRN